MTSRGPEHNFMVNNPELLFHIVHTLVSKRMTSHDLMKTDLKANTIEMSPLKNVQTNIVSFGKQ